MTTKRKLYTAAILSAFCGIVLFCSGCSTSRFTRTLPDGSKLSAWNSRFIWSTEGFEMSYSPSNTTIKLQKANADAQTAGAIAEGVAKGVAGAAK